jgi:uncharacterized membrane protein
MSNSVFTFAQVSSQSIDWRLQKNCALAPAQLGWIYLSLCCISLLIGTFFWLQGAVFVLGFAWLEVMAVGLAFFMYARHAADGEWISIEGSRIVVECETAGRRERAEFDRQWVRIEPIADDRSLIEVSGRGRSVEVGRFVRPEHRLILAQEIRRALRQA